jgi:ABC-2 type transport system ATP-binding protein
MATSILKVERLDIDAEKRRILANLRTGDFNKQRMACEQLSTLAENHFPEFLLRSVTLISDANQLDDRIRERRISADEQGVQIRDLIATAISLLTDMTEADPVGRIAIDQMPPSEKASTEVLADQIADRLSNKVRTAENTDQVSNDDDDFDLIKFIVHVREPKSHGKLIAAEDISKDYGKASFRLKPISLQLNRGEILGVVGVNASGKTTLLRILLGEIKPSSGYLNYPSLEENAKRRDWIHIKSRMGYVSQTLPRWPGRVYDNLCYIASIYGHPLSEIDNYLSLLLKRYGLDRYRDATWDEISGGYKTRFEIVRALLSKPDVLLLDEPLAYLDILSQQVVLRQLRQLARNKARPIGIIITSQQLYEIESVADRLLVLEGGATLFSDRVEKLNQFTDDLVVEFVTTGSMMELKSKLTSVPQFRSLFASETGYIVVFKRNSSGADPRMGKMDFNMVLKVLGQESSGTLSYARDISHSCRVLFEPRISQLSDTSGR